MTATATTPSSPVSLAVADGVIASSGWFLPLIWWQRTPALSTLAFAVLAGGVHVAVGATLGAHRPQLGAFTAIVHRRLFKAGSVTVAAALVVLALSPGSWALTAVDTNQVLLAGLVATTALVLWRWIVEAHRTRRHRSGRAGERVLIVGDHHDAHDLLDLIDAHAGTGWRAAGWVEGDETEPLMTSARRCGASSVLVAPSALRRQVVQSQLHDLRAHGLRVHLDLGLRDLLPRHLTLAALGYEPLVLLEPPRLTAVQHALKRTTDIVVALILLMLSLPVLAVAALAIKLDDRGPVLFHQRRIGRHGVPFDVVKLRTMVPDAEARLAEVAHLNERTDGPLFKATADPRVTRVGRVLRATSIDEIPQLWKVVRGHMSLVGPRPALPEEVHQFDDRLMARHRMRPGITGVWGRAS
jgi:lipopolysaccharide/colanic/teichoic acid biosynthesis glycosyltransferase